MYNEQCKQLQNNFIECKNTCDIIASKLIEFLTMNLTNYIKENEVDEEGNYALIKLFSIIDQTS